MNPSSEGLSTRETTIGCSGSAWETCGRSRPLASDDGIALSTITTAALVSDIEAMRELHAVDKWLVLWGVTTTTEREVDWLTWQMGEVYPEAPDFRLRFARLVTHFFANHGFLEPDAITGRLDRIVDIPATFVRGRLDIASPLGSACRLAQALPNCRLHIVEDEGHGGEAASNVVLTEALDRFVHNPSRLIDDPLPS